MLFGVPRPDQTLTDLTKLKAADGRRKKRTIFAVLNHEAGRGPARLRRLVWDQEIAGSNPAAPTAKRSVFLAGRFLFPQNPPPRLRAGRVELLVVCGEW